MIPTLSQVLPFRFRSSESDGGVPRLESRYSKSINSRISRLNRDILDISFQFFVGIDGLLVIPESGYNPTEPDADRHARPILLERRPSGIVRIL